MNYIDESWIRVSDNIKYQCRRIGERDNHPIVVVDNVLDNPELFVENIIKKTPLEKIIHETVVFPGNQGACSILLQELHTLVAWFINNFSDFKGGVEDPTELDITDQINVVRGGMKCPRVSVQPHVDNAMFAYALYLNKEEDCVGGTSFFKHESTGETNMEYVDNSYKRTEQYWNLKEWRYEFDRKKRLEEVTLDSKYIEDAYEEYHHIPMKYNRMVLYPAYLWHHPIIKGDMFNEPKEPRFSISGFVNQEYFINPPDDEVFTPVN